MPVLGGLNSVEILESVFQALRDIKTKPVEILVQDISRSCSSASSQGYRATDVTGAGRLTSIVIHMLLAEDFGSFPCQMGLFTALAYDMASPKRATP